VTADRGWTSNGTTRIRQSSTGVSRFPADTGNEVGRQKRPDARAGKGGGVWRAEAPTGTRLTPVSSVFPVKQLDRPVSAASAHFAQCRAAGPFCYPCLSVSRVGPHHSPTASSAGAGAQRSQDVAQGGPAVLGAVIEASAGPRRMVFQLFGWCPLMRVPRGTPGWALAMPQWNPRPGASLARAIGDRSSRHRRRGNALTDVSAVHDGLHSAIRAPPPAFPCFESRRERRRQSATAVGLGNAQRARRG